MKFIPVFRRGLQFPILLVALSYCSQPLKNDMENTNITAEETNAVSENKETSRPIAADSLLDMRKYLGIATYRLNEIEDSLDKINTQFNAEKRNLSLELGGRVYQLNKKHLELKTRIRKSLNSTDAASRLELEATLTDELDLLEAAISIFNENREQK